MDARTRLTPPMPCSSAATIGSRTSAPATPKVVARKLAVIRRNAIRTISPLLQPISKPSKHQRQMRSSAARQPSGLHGAGVTIEAVDLYHPVDAFVIVVFNPAAIACRL